MNYLYFEWIFFVSFLLELQIKHIKRAFEESLKKKRTANMENKDDRNEISNDVMNNAAFRTILIYSTE
jgi:hypothetical protein